MRGNFFDKLLKSLHFFDNFILFSKSIILKNPVAALNRFVRSEHQPRALTWTIWKVWGGGAPIISGGPSMSVRHLNSHHPHPLLLLSPHSPPLRWSPPPLIHALLLLIVTIPSSVGVTTTPSLGVRVQIFDHCNGFSFQLWPRPIGFPRAPQVWKFGLNSTTLHDFLVFLVTSPVKNF